MGHCYYCIDDYNRYGYNWKYNINETIMKFIKKNPTYLIVQMTFANYFDLRTSPDFLNKLNKSMKHVRKLKIILSWRRDCHEIKTGYNENLFCNLFWRIIIKILAYFQNLENFKIYNYNGDDFHSPHFNKTNDYVEYTLVQKAIKPLVSHFQKLRKITYHTQTTLISDESKEKANNIAKSFKKYEKIGLSIIFKTPINYPGLEKKT